MELPADFTEALNLAGPHTPLTLAVSQGLQGLSVYPSTEVYVGTVIGCERTHSNGLILWCALLLGWIGAIDVSFWSEDASQRAKDACTVGMWNAQYYPAGLRRVWGVPLPRRPVAAEQPQLVTVQTMLQPSVEVLAPVALRAVHLLRHHVLSPMGDLVDQLRVAGDTEGLVRSLPPDALLFLVACASWLWHVERCYDDELLLTKDHHIRAGDPFIDDVVMWRAHGSPPAIGHPDDASAMVTLASIMVNTAAATYYGMAGVAAPFNMVGAVEDMRRRVVDWERRCNRA